MNILPNNRSSWDVIGDKIGANLSANLPGAVQQGYNRGQLQNSLAEIQKISQNPNSSPLDITLAAMKAGAGIPGSERYLGALIPELVKFAEARRSQTTPMAGELSGQPSGQAPSMPSRQEMPGFMQQPQATGQMQPGGQPQFFPTNVGPQGTPGNIPQAATTGVKVPLLTPSERTQAARQLAKARTDAGIPTKPQDAMAEIIEAEEAKKAHNQSVDTELAQRVGAQKTYGDRAVDYLIGSGSDSDRKIMGAYPEASEEMKTIFQKKGEQASKNGDSEADINRFLANEAKKIRNGIVNAEKDLDAPRLLNGIGRSLDGTYKDLEQSASDIRSHLQPLLDEGLYDTARNILAKKGYGPEEREAILHPLSEHSKAIMNQLPDVRKQNKPVLGLAGIPIVSGPQAHKPLDLAPLKSMLIDLKKADPNFSIILPRKGAEDHGYDWRNYKDALNELEADGFELTDDQKIQRGNLDTPPLNHLEKILHGLNLIGR